MTELNLHLMKQFRVQSHTVYTIGTATGIFQTDMVKV